MKNLIKLPFIRDLDSNLRSKSALIQVILGPRQVGKTTTILHYLKNEWKDEFLYLSADDLLHPNHVWVVEAWQRAQHKNLVLVIDEIQKVPDWSRSIKGLWDKSQREDTNLRCVLLGSSSLDIQVGLSESLTGRFQLIHAYHWNFAESKAAYGLSFEEFLKFGGYPGSYAFRQEEAKWLSFVQSSIINTVIEKDILLNHTVKSPALFKQAFSLLTSYPAQEISYTKLLGQLQDRGNVEVIKHYIHLFEGAYLMKALEKFSTNKIKMKSSSPKILPLAPCLSYMNYQAEYRPTERGRVFELLVGAQLVRTELPLYYWRDGKFEMDYVLKKGKSIFGIEVKSGDKKISLGLKAFKEAFPSSRSVILTLENYQEFEKDPLGFIDRVAL